MGRTTGPKVRISRKLGVPLTPKASKVMAKKPHPPGDRGRLAGRGRARARMSDYKRQLYEKQKLRAQYDVTERQLLNYFKKARERTRREDVITTDALVQLLETRLDAVAMRGGLATTIYAARQIVSHGHVLVNGERVNIPSYNVGVGDVISVKAKSQDIPNIVEASEAASPPSYVQLDKGNMSVRLVYLPTRDEIPVICEVPLVIEFYSR